MADMISRAAQRRYQAVSPLCGFTFVAILSGGLSPTAKRRRLRGKIIVMQVSEPRAATKPRQARLGLASPRRAFGLGYFLSPLQGEIIRRCRISSFLLFRRTATALQRFAVGIELCEREVDGQPNATPKKRMAASTSYAHRLFASTAIACLFIAAGASFVPLAA
jgi:hypothetical protein